MARRQFSARLNVMPEFHDMQREVILKGLMEELEILAENLIVLALDYGNLNATNLKRKAEVSAKKKDRCLILTEEVD